LKQTYENWEQIVIDDGSTDRTADIIRSFLDSRIRYVHQENRGIEALAHTYNRALSVSKGELIAILEGDDLWPPDKLATLVPAFADSSVVLAYGAVGDVSADGPWNGKLRQSVRKRMTLPRGVLFNNPIGSATKYMLRADGVELVAPSTAIVRRSELQSIGGFQFVRNLCVVDFPTFIRVSLLGSFFYTPIVMGFRRRHSESVMARHSGRIVAQAQQYAKAFLAEHFADIPLDERELIECSWAKAEYSLAFSLGRMHSLNKQWGLARFHFSRAIGPHSVQLSAAALAGWALSLIHCDLEALLALAGVSRLDRTEQAGPASALSNHTNGR